MPFIDLSLFLPVPSLSRSFSQALMVFTSVKMAWYLPFTRENGKFQLEDQMVRAIPFAKLQRKLGFDSW